MTKLTALQTLLNNNVSKRIIWDSNTQGSIDLARYSRQDHGGGEDGDEWMDEGQIADEYALAVNENAYYLQQFVTQCNNAQVTVEAYWDLGYKGHFRLVFNIVRKSKAKIATNIKTLSAYNCIQIHVKSASTQQQSTQQKRKYTYTNKALNLVSNPDKVRTLLANYLQTHSVAQVKTCKTIRNAIATSVNITNARANVLIRDNISKVHAKMQA